MTEAPPGWDDFVRSHHQGSLYQTTLWANYMEKSFWAIPYFLQVKDDHDTVIGQCLYVKKSIVAEAAANKGLRIIGLLVKIPVPFLHRLWWQIGPLAVSPKHEASLLQAMKEELLVQQGITVLPSSFYPMSPPYPELLPYQTIVRDLREISTFESIYPLLKRKVRASIRKTLEVPLLVSYYLQDNILHHLPSGEKTILPEKEVMEIYKAYRNVLVQRKKTLGQDLPPHFPNHYTRKYLPHHSGLVLIYFEGRIIAGSGIFHYGKKSHLVAPAISDERITYKLAVGELTQFLALWVAKSILHVETYDFMGINPFPTTDKEVQISRFKRKFGNETFDYYYFTDANFTLKRAEL